LKKKGIGEKNKPYKHKKMILSNKKTKYIAWFRGYWHFLLQKIGAPTPLAMRARAEEKTTVSTRRAFMKNPLPTATEGRGSVVSRTISFAVEQ
jgi:hypothetical protein